MAEFDIMEVRKQYLHREVRIIDGSSEDGNLGMVVSVTAGSAEPLTVLFSILSGIPRRGFYGLGDVQLTGQEWQEGKERDQAVRCRKDRFTGLWHIIDGKGQRGPGAGTEGGAWASYLHDLTAELAGREKNGDSNRKVARRARKDNHLAGAADGHVVQRHVALGEGDIETDASECAEAAGTHGS